MQKNVNIIVNAITLDDANLIPLLSKTAFWSKNHHIIWATTQEIVQRHQIKASHIVVPQIFFLDRIWKLILIGIIRNILIFPKLFKQCKTTDILYSISATFDLCLAPFFLKLCGKKFVWAVVFDNWVSFQPQYGLKNYLATAFFRLSLSLLKKADCIFYISPELGAKLKNHGFADKHLFKSQNGIEKELMVEAMKNRIKTSQTNAFLFDAVYVGRIHLEKGIFDLLDSVKKIASHFPNFKVAIVGTGEAEFVNSVKESIKRKKLDKIITLVGRKTRKEKFRYLEQSRCFLFLSHHESFGVALLEAVAVGLPAITYHLPVYTEIYKKKEIISVNYQDTDKVADAVLQLFEKGDFLNKKGTQLLDNFKSWEEVAEAEATFFSRHLSAKK